MTWFGRALLHPARDWIWRRLVLLWRCLTRICVRALGLVTRLALPAPEERGQRDPEVDGAAAESSKAAAAMKRAAASQAAPEGDFTKRPKYEEEESGKVDDDDDFYCDYDSTWEDEESGSPTPRRVSGSYKFRNFQRAARDMQNFRHGYPNQGRKRQRSRNASDDMPNLMFYLGQEAAQPDGFFIFEFHSKWHGQYERLESVHTFIQWLFPLQEQGLNSQACPLTPEEIEEFRKCDEAKENLLKSYQLILDFYGIELCDKKTGEVKRSPNWKDRFDNLNRHTHNNLRITRILKCLGTLGFEHYQVPLVHFFLNETLVRRELPRVKESVLNYFVFAVLDRIERRKLIKFAFLNYRDTDEFVWCPKKIQERWPQNKGNVQASAPSFLPSVGVSSPNTEDGSEEEDTENLF